MSISLQKIHVGTSYRLSLLALYVTQQVLYSKHIDLKTFPLFFFSFCISEYNRFDQLLLNLAPQLLNTEQLTTS